MKLFVVKLVQSFKTKVLRSFKSKILLSYFTFNRIFLLWICIYFFINKKQTDLNLFTNNLTHLQNNYAQGNRYLQNFILTGYHQSSFYTTGKQSDIDLFFAEQDTIINNIEKIKKEAHSNYIEINDQVQALTSLHKNLHDTVNLLKQLYLLKGFKDFGAEGTIRKYAHFLEDSSPVSKMDILMLRRREKDFMLREEKKYIDEFNLIADEQIKKFSSSPVTLNALIKYKGAFNDFANYAGRININTEQGMYGHVHHIIAQLDAGYFFIDAKAAKEVSKLNNIFKIILIASFIILLLAAIFFSFVLSHGLTKDIKKLNKKVASFVKSGFKEDEEEHHDTLTSKITEIQGLNSDFLTLRQTLKITLSDLENSFKEEKKNSANLETTITNLLEQMREIEKEKQQIENSEVILNAFFESAISSHILIGNDMEIIAFNKAATSLIKDVYGKEIIIAGRISDYIDELYLDKFINDYQQALTGRIIRYKRLLDHVSSQTVLYDISFLPVSDKEGNIVTVSFNATPVEQ